MATNSVDLERFVRAHDDDYAQALAEIRAGRKRSHWMWYILSSPNLPAQTFTMSTIG